MEGDQGDLARLVYLTLTLSTIHLVTQRDIENVQLTGASNLGGIRRSSLSGLAS